MNLYVPSICILVLLLGVTAANIIKVDTSTTDETQNYQQCFDKDSISCLQLAVYRKAKSFFDKPTIDLFAGLSFTKSIENSRSAKSIEDNSITVETSKSVEDRNSEIESYLWTNAKNFFQERSLNLNFANAARSVANAIPDNIKSDIKDLVFEGRTKKKLLLKKLLPILLGVKVKIFLLIFGSLFGLLLMAKKALITSIVALGLAAFAGISSMSQRNGSGGGGGGFLSGLGSLFGGGASASSPTAAWGSPGAGWSSGSGAWNGGGNGGWGAGAGWGGGGGWDSHGSYSSPVAQSLAYSGHKPTTR